MDIVILGAGKTGAFVASTLTKEGYNVILIDKDAKVLERVGRETDIATLHAGTPSWKLFENLSKNKTTLFFAATADDETNLISCSIAKNLGIKKTAARVQSKEYLSHPAFDFGKLFFVDHFISPEVLAAQDLCKALIHSNDLAAQHFAHGAIQMRTVQIPDRWDRGGTPIRELAFPEDLIAGLIRRKLASGEEILIPRGADHILPGDQVTLVGGAKVMNKLHEIFGSPETPVRSIIIVGGTSVAVHLTHFLSEQKIPVRLIEKNAARCDELADLLPQATIINRDGKDPQLLLSERIQNADALVSCTDSDETNILTCGLAKEMGCPKAIAQITETSYIPLLDKLGILPAFSPRVNVANRILSILGEETTLSIASLSCDAAKIIETKVAPTSNLLNIPLADLNTVFPKDCLIAVIQSQGKVMVGRGNQTLRAGDIVISICHVQQIPKLQLLFR